jgi:hypothetical protein
MDTLQENTDAHNIVVIGHILATIQPRKVSHLDPIVAPRYE